MPGRRVTICVLAVGMIGGITIMFLNRQPAVSAGPTGPAASRNLQIAGTSEGYLDAAVCAECHAEIAKTYARTGMARSFGAIQATTPADIFPEGAFQHSASQQFFTMFRRDGRPYLKRHLAGAGGEPVEQREAEAHYWIGSGNRGRGFVHRANSGRLLLLPVTWYAEGGGRWAMNPGYDRPLHTGFERVIDYRCMSCHAGFPQIEPGADLFHKGWHYPGKLAEGIDCQRCHGPGGRHVEAVRQGQSIENVRGAIVNPARLPRERPMEVCMQCHLETTGAPLPHELIRFDRGVFSYRPGQPLGEWVFSFDYSKAAGYDDRFEFVSSVYRLVKSACFRESRGAMTCTTCHNPHDIPRGEAAVQHYSSACRKCHQLTAAHPQVSECVSCHMPKRTPSDAIHLRVTDHFIRRRPAPDSGKPLAESTAQPYRGKVVLYELPERAAAAENDLYVAVAQVTEQANLEQGVARLEELVKRLQPQHGEFYLQLGNGWRNLGRLDRSRHWLEEAVRRMPDNWRPLVLLAGTFSATGETDRAIDLLRRAATLAPHQTAPIIQLGEIYMAQDKPAEAIEAFRAAIQIDGESAEAYNRLGAAHMASGDSDASEKALREAVRLRPEFSQARANLASLLAVMGNFPEARHHFELVLRLDPSFASARSAYATALAQRGMFAEARPHYEEALRKNPADAVAHQNLAAVLRQLGETNTAIREYLAAIRYQPDYYEAHLGLGELYLAIRHRDASVHLRKAAESTDPEVRGAAATLLARAP